MLLSSGENNHEGGAKKMVNKMSIFKLNRYEKESKESLDYIEETEKSLVKYGLQGLAFATIPSVLAYGASRELSNLVEKGVLDISALPIALGYAVSVVWPLVNVDGLLNVPELVNDVYQLHQIRRAKSKLESKCESKLVEGGN
jgi:hypothetical protein